MGEKKEKMENHLRSAKALIKFEAPPSIGHDDGGGWVSLSRAGITDKGSGRKKTPGGKNRSGGDGLGGRYAKTLR